MGQFTDIGSGGPDTNMILQQLMGGSFNNYSSAGLASTARQTFTQMQAQQLQAQEEARRQAALAAGAQRRAGFKADPNSGGQLYGGAHGQQFGSLGEAQGSYRAEEDRKRQLMDEELQRNLQRQALQAATSKNERFGQAFGNNRLGDLMKLLMGKMQNERY